MGEIQIQKSERERERETDRQTETDRNDYEREGGEFAGGRERCTQIQKSDRDRELDRGCLLCTLC